MGAPVVSWHLLRTTISLVYEVFRIASITNSHFTVGLLYSAPEVLRHVTARASQKSDVYSFGIILHEIYGRSGPWGSSVLKPKGSNNLLHVSGTDVIVIHCPHATIRVFLL